jgi:hypothetical protein
MPDSLLLDGTDDYLQFSPGAATIGAGPITLAMILKRNSTLWNCWVAAHTSGGSNTNLWIGELTDNSYSLPNRIMMEIGGGAFGQSLTTGTVVNADNWCLVAATKASGAVAPRYHRYKYDTAAWIHGAATGGTVGDGTALASSGSIRFGQAEGIDFFAGNMLVFGVWNSVLDDATLETLTPGIQAWIDAEPLELLRFDRTSTITSLVGTAAETTRVGTTLDTGDAPAGWSDVIGSRPLVDVDYSRFPKHKLARV